MLRLARAKEKKTRDLGKVRCIKNMDQELFIGGVVFVCVRLLFLTHDQYELEAKVRTVRY